MRGLNGVPAFRVRCFWRTDCFLKDVYRIPGRDEQVYVISFFGDAFGDGETQVPVLVRPGLEEAYRVEWKRPQ
jgi:hypothetical protein